jgi:hypothetical protein
MDGNVGDLIFDTIPITAWKLKKSKTFLSQEVRIF